MADQVKISVGMIIRDEASTLEACLQSLRPHVDEIVIVDTGSVDNSLEIARKYADKVETYLECNDAEGRIQDFAMARQRSMDLASHPWFFWCDGDDVVVGAEHLRALAEQAEKVSDNFHWLFAYEYSHDPATGACTALQWRERLIGPKHRYAWTSPVHEICVPMQPVEGTLANGTSDKVRIIHRTHVSTKTKEEHRNLRILRDYIGRIGDADPRALYYLGVEAAIVGDVPTALSALKRYVNLGHWDDELCQAQLSLANIYRVLGDFETSITWACRALVEKSWPDPFLELAKSYYELARAGAGVPKNWHRIIHFCSVALSLVNPSPLIQDPNIRGELHRYLSHAYGQINKADEALASCQEALKYFPGDADLNHNLALYRAAVAGRQVQAGLDQLGLSEPQARLIKSVLNGTITVTSEAPTEGVTTDDTPKEMVLRQIEIFGPPPGKLDLVFFCGHGLEPWNPVSLEQNGMGGSETMLWGMAKRLRKLGHRVRVYGHATRTMEGTYDGVEWFDSSRFKDLTCDVLITSRRPDAVDPQHNVTAKATILWVHDVHVGEALTAERDLRIDRVLCLSEWHKGYFGAVYPRLDKRKILVTRNGVDLSRFNHKVERNPKRVIYSSSPDRGLENLLSVWPAVLREEPEAELHLFYGFLNWERASQMRGDVSEQRRIAHVRRLIQATPRVRMHDRVNGQELALEFLKSGVWAYPTWFSETSCITAMEAQQAGCHVVTSALAALKETVKSGNKIAIPVNQAGAPAGDVMAGVQSREYLEPFTAALLTAIRDQDEYPRPMPGDAFSLDTLAQEWSELLTKIHADVTEAVVPPFVDAPEACQ